MTINDNEHSSDITATAENHGRKHSPSPRPGSTDDSDDSRKRRQNAQLSQRDRAAGCVIVLAKSGTGRQYFTDIMGLSSTTVI